MKGGVKKGAGVLVTLGVLGLLGAFGVRLWLFGGAPAMPELLQNVGDTRKDADQQAFAEKLRQRFPLGSAEADLSQELRRQGFVIRAAQREATYDRAAGLRDLCRRGGNVRWSADAAGTLTALTGGFYVYCPQN